MTGSKSEAVPLRATLAIDFGGTRIRAAWFDAGQMQTRHETLTQVEETADAVIGRLLAVAHQAVPSGQQPQRIGIAAPGPLDAAAGIIFQAKTLPGWSQVPLRQIVQDSFSGVPTLIENDANLGAWAEYQRGARAGNDPLIYLTLSTGVGGGAILNGQVFTGARGLAIEPGHLRFPQPDGSILSLEQLVSGTGIAASARHRLQSDARPSLLRAAAVVDGYAVGRAAQAGDALALAIIHEAGTWLGLGLVSVLHLFNPQAVILGGSVTQLGDLLLQPAYAAIHANILHPLFIPAGLISLASLGDDVCLWGAALYAQHRL